jgi:hypothetical protein
MADVRAVAGGMQPMDDVRAMAGGMHPVAGVGAAMAGSLYSVAGMRMVHRNLPRLNLQININKLPLWLQREPGWLVRWLIAENT